MWVQDLSDVLPDFISQPLEIILTFETFNLLLVSFSLPIDPSDDFFLSPGMLSDWPPLGQPGVAVSGAVAQASGLCGREFLQPAFRLGI